MVIHFVIKSQASSDKLNSSSSPSYTGLSNTCFHLKTFNHISSMVGAVNGGYPIISYFYI